MLFAQRFEIAPPPPPPALALAGENLASGFDARGHAGLRTDGSNNLQLLYYAAERVRQINDSSAGRALKVFTFGNGTGAGDRSRGKVKTGVLSDNWSCALTTTIPVQPMDALSAGDSAVGGHNCGSYLRGEGPEGGYGCASEEVDGRDEGAGWIGSVGSACGDAPQHSAAARRAKSSS